MAKKNKATASASEETEIRGRLRRLKIRNFRAIGSSPVEVDLDDIVVLVGPNNSGKSLILRAYEIIMLDGSKDGYLKLEDFPNCVIDPDNLPEIELETEVVDGEPGEQWIKEINGKQIVRERWSWSSSGVGKRCGWNVNSEVWDKKFRGEHQTLQTPVAPSRMLSGPLIRQKNKRSKSTSYLGLPLSITLRRLSTKMDNRRI